MKQVLSPDSPPRVPSCLIGRQPIIARARFQGLVRGCLAFCLGPSLLLGTAESTPPLRTVIETKDPRRAELLVKVEERFPYPVPKYITGKFAEHLGANIYNGMSAQVLRNPTFAEYPIWTGGMSPDGVTRFYADEERITQELRRQAARVGWPDAALDELGAARKEGLACWWTRVGSHAATQVSPDTGPHGGRAQRVRVRTSGEGIAQWVRLPLHRTRRYEFEVLVRSPDVGALAVSLATEGAVEPLATATVAGLSRAWRAFRGVLELPPTAIPTATYRLAVTADSPGQFVVAHALLWPADHIHGADPDVIRRLREAHLPILRWPGGNFVSGYHWEDGIGPIDRRPTLPNYAWGGVEPNLFGIDEFVTFCRDVGCEPFICINAGSGTPEEAARWIEYCNGPARSPQGSRRAANGHPKPYRIQHWEIGNELWGRWQFNWTTAAGYVDRLAEFSRAMLEADPSIQLYACGAPVMWGKEWNDTLISKGAKLFNRTTDHPLVGGTVGPATDPLDVYRDFMATPDFLEKKWGDLRDQMAAAGIKSPRLAVTELQMFAHLGRADAAGGSVRLTSTNLVNPGTLAEGLYDVLIFHAAIRLQPFVDMVTHSATVNHGGGLRKEREQVYPNPCYFAQAAFAAFADAVPVAVELKTAFETAPLVLPELKQATSALKVGTVDAMAAVARDGALLISIVHRGTSGPIRLEIQLRGYTPAPIVQVHTLAGPVPWAANTLAEPTAIQPVDRTVEVRGDRLELDLDPFTVARLRLAPKS